VLLSAALALVLPANAGAFGPLSSFGAFGGAGGELNGPRGVAVAEDGTAYVAESGGDRVSAFGPDGTFLGVIGAGSLSGPVGVAIGPEGNVFISDAGNDRIAVYSPEGSFVRAFGNTVLDEPLGIEFDGAGLLHVADAANARIDVFMTGGRFVLGIGKDVEQGGTGDVCTPASNCKAGVADGSAGAMGGPQDVAFGPDGELVVASLGNRRVDVFAPDGSFLRAFGEDVNLGIGEKDVCTSECQAGVAGADAGAFESPAAVTANAAGDVYVADWVNNRVSVSRLDGAFVRAFGRGVINGGSIFQICNATTGCQAGETGTSPGAISEPNGIALDCRGAIQVAEEGPGFARVERFGEPGTPAPSCLPPPPREPIAVLAVRPPSNRFRLVGLIKNRSNGSAVLFVRVPGPGRVFLWGRGVRRKGRTARRAKTVPMPVKPKIPLKRFLKQHGRGRIRVNVGFEPTGGVPREREKVIVLKRRKTR
jgi:DNA-binding beta-propeller fold protein YncE